MVFFLSLHLNKGFHFHISMFFIIFWCSQRISQSLTFPLTNVSCVFWTRPMCDACFAPDQCVMRVLLTTNVSCVFCSRPMCRVCCAHDQCVVCVLLTTNVSCVFCSRPMCHVCSAHDQYVMRVLLTTNMSCVFCSRPMCHAQLKIMTLSLVDKERPRQHLLPWLWLC